MQTPRFTMNWNKEEKHLMMPEITTLVSIQSLYEILFQYVITEEKEARLRKLVRSMEDYIEEKRRGLHNAPFSVPVESLSFLDDGVEELRYLCWLEIPVYRVDVSLADGTPPAPEEWEKIKEILGRSLVFRETSLDDPFSIYVYPSMN